MITVRVHQGRLEARGARLEDHDLLIDLRDLWEERAAILEFEAGFTKVEAEDWAMYCLTLRLSGERSESA